MFQHTAARRRLEVTTRTGNNFNWVSTHSRPKAAGEITKAMCKDYASFNTQPPEGGWVSEVKQPEGFNRVSTHSRPKAAGGCR